MNRMEIDRHGLQVLDRAECMQLLSASVLGRVAITSRGLPVVLPINFRLVGSNIVFRTDSGTQLHAGTDNAVVAFEADDIDPRDHTGWSVVVTGMARATTDAAELAALCETPLSRWTSTGAARAVALSADFISGRRSMIDPGR
jgi:uncharacterized protein